MPSCSAVVGPIDRDGTRGSVCSGHQVEATNSLTHLYSVKIGARQRGRGARTAAAKFRIFNAKVHCPVR
jgi:hypothetical protein